MGLLDQILGGLAGNVPGRGTTSGQVGGGTSGILMALLPVVLSMLANRQGGAGSGGGLGGLGGLGGALGGALSGGMGGMGGTAGGGMGGLGGLGGLLEQFTQRGYARHASSWVGTGPNEAIPPDAIGEVFGQEQISQIAAQAGVTDDEARTGLAELLPQMVDHLTPQGQLPGQDEFLASIDDFERQLPR